MKKILHLNDIEIYRDTIIKPSNLFESLNLSENLFIGLNFVK